MSGANEHDGQSRRLRSPIVTATSSIAPGTRDPRRDGAGFNLAFYVTAGCISSGRPAGCSSTRRRRCSGQAYSGQPPHVHFGASLESDTSHTSDKRSILLPGARCRATRPGRHAHAQGRRQTTAMQTSCPTPDVSGGLNLRVAPSASSALGPRHRKTRTVEAPPSAHGRREGCQDRLRRFQSDHEVAKLIGAPRVPRTPRDAAGSDPGEALAGDLARVPVSVVLFDEIERRRPRSRRCCSAFSIARRSRLATTPSSISSRASSSSRATSARAR